MTSINNKLNTFKEAMKQQASLQLHWVYNHISISNYNAKIRLEQMLDKNKQ